MNKLRIRQNTPERCLLTEIAPYETPIVFSNWGSYNYEKNLASKPVVPNLLKKMFEKGGWTTPYKFRIQKDADSTRTLFLTHPKHSKEIVSFYQRNAVFMLRACKRSHFSLRAPHRVARFYFTQPSEKDPERRVEEITAESSYAYSYFAYDRYSHLHRFFDSDEFTELEKQFTHLLHLDIAKFFASLYTHSIAWAVRGKVRTKSDLRNNVTSRSFDADFDVLLRRINANETNGIAIGPELSRIFSEIILQRIDANVVSSLAKIGLQQGKHYSCCRYIDDYYFFFNEENARALFTKKLSEELEKFKLFLNASKATVSERPFISDISVLKIKLSEFLDGIAARVQSGRSVSAQREINHFRSIVRTQQVSFVNVSVFFLSAIIRKVRKLNAEADSFSNEFFVFLELAFYSFRMDVRVATSNRIASVVLGALKKRPSLKAHEWHKLIDKIVFELRGAIDSALAQGCVIECMNLLIIAAEIDTIEVVSSDWLKSAITVLRGLHNDEYSTLQERLSYFEIVSLLYYFGKKKMAGSVQDLLIDEAVKTLSEFPVVEYAESAYLLLDLVSCPHLGRDVKNRLINISMSHSTAVPSTEHVGAFRNFVSARHWFFHWNESDDLETHLRKKQLLLSY